MESSDPKTLAEASAAECRQLLGKADRTRAEDQAMIAAAHASLKYRQQIGSFVEEQRGNRLVARAYIAVGLVEPALEFARRAMEITAKHHEKLADYDRAFAKELAARAWALAGNLPRAAHHHADAHMLGEAIGDDNHRREFFRMFEAGPWFRLKPQD